MCKFVPFITTTSVLSGSLTLVAIALDRYLAVMRPVLGFWSPDKRFSTLSMLLIWACSIGSSGPLLGIYDYRKIYLLDVEDSSEESEEVVTAVPEELVVTELEMVHMCLAGDVSQRLDYRLIQLTAIKGIWTGGCQVVESMFRLSYQPRRKQFMQFYKYSVLARRRTLLRHTVHPDLPAVHCVLPMAECRDCEAALAAEALPPGAAGAASGAQGGSV